MNPWRAAAAAVVLCLFAAGTLRREGSWFALALPLAAWLLGSRAYAETGDGETPDTSLVAVRDLSDVFPSEGMPVRVTVLVRNPGPRLDFVHIRDSLPKGARFVSGSISWKGSLPSGAEIELRYLASFPRGRYDYESLQARAEDPFFAHGLAFAVPCPGSVIVPPRPIEAPRLALGAGAVRPYSGLSGATRPGDGAEFHGTRDYRPGDRLRDLNWRAGALWGRSVVNVFEGDRAIDAGVILDCRAEAYVSDAVFEAAVAASLSVAESFLDGGNRVAFMLYGSSLLWIPPGAGSAHRYKIRAAAARAELGDHAVFERFDHLPVNVFPPRSLVILVSPLEREDAAKLRAMSARGYSVAVLRPSEGQGTPLRYDGSGRQDQAGRVAARIARLEGRLLGARLDRAGITVMDWDIDAPLSALRPVSGGPAGARR